MRTNATSRRVFLGMCAASAGAWGAPRNPAVEKAMESLRASIAKAAADPERPVYHFHPPGNWMNDPNGTIFYGGWHHLFYQLNPYGSEWGHMHWGHARSKDLVNWEHLPVALWPSEALGEKHCYSGGAILAGDGRPRILYTSIGDRAPEIWLAEPVDEDLIEWRKSPGNPVLTTKAHVAHRIEDWRDPFLFHESGGTYMVCGGNTNGQVAGGSGQVQLYRATKPDLTAWTHLGCVFENRDQRSTNVECPNLFKLGSKWVLLISPEKPVESFVGSLDLPHASFKPEGHGVLDPGSGYATNISFDKSRCLLWMWGKTNLPEARGWNGVMAMPRVLSIDDQGFLRQKPAAELAVLRGEGIEMGGEDIGTNPLAISRIAGDCLEIDAQVNLGSAESVALRLRCGGGRVGTEIAYHASGAFSNGGGSTIIGRNRKVRMNVFLDKCVVEAFANDGEAAIFNTLAAGRQDLGVELVAHGGSAHLEFLRAWKMRPADFSMERFGIQ